MSDWILQQLSEVNVPELVALAVCFFLSHRYVKNELSGLRSELKSDISQIKNELKSDIAEVKNDISRIETKVDDINMRLCRLEGAFMSKECCLLKTTSVHKAE